MLDEFTAFSEADVIIIRRSPKILVVTGFGSFGSVDKNPTQDMVQDFAQTVKVISTGDGEIPVFFATLEVSQQCVDLFLNNLERLMQDDQELILIHLGVDEKCERIKLEEFAYNNATFRIPDMRGSQPVNHPITSALALDMPCRTAVKVRLLHSAISEFCVHKIDAEDLVTISADPGRYLCNYVYYRSLLFRPKPGTHSLSLFIHVPPFTRIEKEIQKRILLELIHLIVFEQK